MKRNLFAILLLLGGLALLILFPQAAGKGVVDGLRLCGATLLPALFPFFVLTRFCASLWSFSFGEKTESRMRRWFGLGGCCLPALALSFVGGYPVGVSAVCDLYRAGRLTKQNAERCLTVCNNSGPAFFIGVAGAGVFHSVPAGLALYGIHVISALLCARCFAQPEVPRLRVRRLPQPPVSAARAFSDAITGACAASLQISATVILCSVLLALLRLTPFAGRIAPLIGIFELTSGVLQLTDSAASFVLAAFYLGWGGFCVHLQAMALWGELKPHGYFAEKLLHGLLSGIFATALCRPSALSVLCAVSIGAACLISPALRKKRAGNLQKNTL